MPMSVYNMTVSFLLGGSAGGKKIEPQEKLWHNYRTACR